jgi:hypothetical protein
LFRNSAGTPLLFFLLQSYQQFANDIQLFGRVEEHGPNPLV